MTRSAHVCVRECVCVGGRLATVHVCFYPVNTVAGRTFGCRARERPGTESADSSDFI